VQVMGGKSQRAKKGEDELVPAQRGKTFRGNLLDLTKDEKGQKRGEKMVYKTVCGLKNIGEVAYDSREKISL